MDNIIKYKLSQYKDIKSLNEEGTVVLSYDLINDRTCVIKYIDREKKPIYNKIKSIDCYSLPEIYDIFEADNKCVIAEKYIKGISLEQLINEKGTLTEKRACDYVLDICQALRAVHGSNIIHRDVSPDNIIIDENDKAVLLDFDIAREGQKERTTDTEILGTAGFASPEQYGFAQTDARSDIYSMGVILNYMLTGSILQDNTYNTEPLCSVIKKSVQIDPNSRYRNIDELRSDIKKQMAIIDNKNKVCKNAAFNNIPDFHSNEPLKKSAKATVYVFYSIMVIFCFAAYDSLFSVVTMLIFIALLSVIPMLWFGNKDKIFNKIPIINKFGDDSKMAWAIIIYVVVFLTYCINVPVPK